MSSLSSDSNNSVKNIDFRGLLELYKRTGDQEKVDKVIDLYIKSFLSDAPEAREYPFLKDIALSPRVISGTPKNKLITILLNGGQPVSGIVDELMKANCFYDFKKYDMLFKRGFITAEDLEHVIVGANIICVGRGFSYNIRNIIDFMSIEDLSSYEGINLSNVEDALVKYISKGHLGGVSNEDLESLLRVIFRLLTTLPYDTLHRILVDTIKDIRMLEEKSREKQNSEEAKAGIIIEDFAKSLLKDLSVKDTINLLYTRPDYQELFKKINEARKVLDDHIDMNVLFNSICDGSIGCVVFVMKLFPSLRSRSVDIINAWVKNGMTLQLDVYFDYLISDRTDPRDDLDGKYEWAMQPENAKNFVVEPVGGSSSSQK